MLSKLFHLKWLLIYIYSHAITRFGLSLYSINVNQINFLEVPSIFLIGLINDVISTLYFIPIISLSIIIFSKLINKFNILIPLAYFAFIFYIIILISCGVAQIIFWDEFGTNFNFIAVDYLVYTHEIIGTLKESFPYIKIISCIVLVAIIITFYLRNYIISNLQNNNLNRFYLKFSITTLCLCLIAHKFYDSSKFSLNNKYADELAKNGPYELFSAYFNNSLDYDKFYQTIDKSDALNITRLNILQSNQKFLDSNGVLRQTNSNLKSTSKYNVVLIVVESLSAEFMGKFGNSNNLTRYLDKLADESIFFTNLYATGTRTVRGLEAVTLSLPPIPGSSIIRRPNNSNLYNIGSVFRAQGYDIHFIFGGYSYFDNLQKFFEGNKYKIVDRGNLKNEEISFSNIWGVADEDILLKSHQIMDENFTQNKPFFTLITTTSNHRPYTFPNGKIDLASGSGRYAAVKYTDYALGEFIEKSKNKPWFDNTIFIITADHCASSSGKTNLPINKYHIPLLIYAPKILKPTKIDNLASQIDIAPTILGLLNFDYKSKFFGTDIINHPLDRAFISTYQLLGFMKNQHLVILAPNSIPQIFKLGKDSKIEVEGHEELVKEAIAYYQSAYELYINDSFKE